MISRPAFILALLTLLNFVNYLDRFLVSAVAPKIQESLGINDAQIGWITSAFMFGYFLTITQTTQALVAWMSGLPLGQYGVYTVRRADISGILDGSGSYPWNIRRSA